MTLTDGEFVTYSYEEVSEDFDTFCKASGIRNSPLTEVLTASMDPEALNTPLGCVAYSTPPQEGKTTWIVHYIAWQLIRNPWLKVVYATYSQARANAVSRQIRGLVAAWSPLNKMSSSVQRWETKEGGGLLAAGRGSAMTGFRSDMTVIDDPIKDMQEAQSQLIRETTVEWFSSVVLTRMANLSQIIVIATRWHKDDLISHVRKAMNAKFINVPAQATSDDDILGRDPGTWLESVQNRSEKSWNVIKGAVGTYVWQALYQGDPKMADGGMINVDKMDVIPWDQVVFKDDHGFMQTLSRALVIQSWDLTFGTVPQQSRSSRQQGGTGDYVAGHVYVVIGEKWILVDRVHGRFTFTQTLNQVQLMAARWPQTSRIYVEKAANGAAVIDSLKKRAALIKPVSPKGSKEARALAVQPIIDSGNLAILDMVIAQQDGLQMLQEFRDFPFGAHDDDVDALTQALNNGRADYFAMRN
jgi:predicted phage terminase large subunit-like protein